VKACLSHFQSLALFMEKTEVFQVDIEMPHGPWQISAHIRAAFTTRR